MVFPWLQEPFNYYVTVHWYLFLDTAYTYILPVD